MEPVHNPRMKRRLDIRVQKFIALAQLLSQTR